MTFNSILTCRLVACAVLACALLLSGTPAMSAQPSPDHRLAATTTTQMTRSTLPSELLFVPTGREQINIYSLRAPGKGPLAQITAGLVGDQYQETVDTAGNLYVVNDNFNVRDQEYVSVYAPPYNGTPKILQAFGLLPIGVAVDTAGTVYVSNCGAFCYQTPTIYVYANGSTNPTGSITSSAFSSVGFLLVDKSGNLFAPSSNRATGAGDVFEIPAGSSTPTALHLKGLFNFGGPGTGGVAMSDAGDLYVTNNSNSQYVLGFKPGAQVAFRIIDPFSFLDTPGAIVFGPDDLLYVPINCANNSCEGSVVGFRSGAKTPTIAIGPPGPGINGLATLPNANLTGQRLRALADAESLASTFAPQGSTASWPSSHSTWHASPPKVLQRPFDLRGSRAPVKHSGGWLSREAATSKRLLYLGDLNANTVNIYRAQGQAQAPIGVLTSGISSPQGIATDSSSNLYVANSGNNTVTVYPPGQTNPSVTYTNGVGAPFDVKVGSDGTVYVANVFAFSNNDGSVTEYPAGSVNPSTTLTLPGENAVSVALDASNNLYVAWFSLTTYASSVYKYAPGSSTGTNLGLDLPAGSFPTYGMAFDHSGNLVLWYESLDHSINYLAAFPPGAIEPTIKLQGGSFLNNVVGIAFPKTTASETYLGSVNRNLGVRLTYPKGIPLDVIGAQATGVALSPNL